MKENYLMSILFVCLCGREREGEKGRQTRVSFKQHQELMSKLITLHPICSAFGELYR